MKEQEFDELVKIFHRKIINTPTQFYRYLYPQIEWRDSLIGIKGPKECGKTTLILQHIKNSFEGSALDKVLYVSLDNLWFTTHDIREVVEYHYNCGGTHIFLDEIHYFEHWQTLIKNLSDDFPGLNIVYTGSSMLQIESGEGDLSRRQAMYEMRGLSFREYLQFEDKIQLEPIALEYLLQNHVGIATDICGRLPEGQENMILPLFKKYLKEGYYPFYKTIYGDLNQRIQAIVSQIIERDYPRVEGVTESTIRKTRKMLMVMAERVPQLPKMSEIYKQLETDRNMGLKMMRALERAGLLLLLGDDTKSPNNLSRPDKIYINNPTLMYALSPYSDIGTIRETFFMNQLSESHDVRYPKAGDFKVDKKYLFEVGGKSKTFEQIKDLPNSFLAIDDTEIGRKARIPLWMFGLLY